MSEKHSPGNLEPPEEGPHPHPSGKETLLLRLCSKIILRPESWPLQFPLGLSLVPRKRMTTPPADTGPP